MIELSYDELTTLIDERIKERMEDNLSVEIYTETQPEYNSYEEREIYKTRTKIIVMYDGEEIYKSEG